MAPSVRSSWIAGRTRLAAGGAAAVAALLLAACGSSTSNHTGGTGAGGGSSPTAASPAATSAATVTTRRNVAGIYLTDQSGRTLYLFTPDKPNASVCSGACATAWPPFTVTSKPTGTGLVKTSLLGTITRSDGSTQVTYAGHPLYYYVKDLKPGETLGQGLNKSWYLVGPFGNVMQRPVGSGAASPA